MSRILKKYLGVLAALPFLLTPAISGAFELPGSPTFAAGIGLTGASVHTLGTETDPEGTTNDEKIYDSAAVEYVSIFGEARFNIQDRFGVTVGLSVIPGEAEFVTETKPDQDLQDVATGLATGTSTVTGTISEHVTLYIQPTVRLTDMFSVYLTAGISTMDVEADATLVTSTNFTKSVSVDGTRYGVGVMAERADGLFIKIEGNASEYDNVSFTTSDSTVAKADIDEESISVLIGKAF
jgi:opacity protein-like surface antigen